MRLERNTVFLLLTAVLAATVLLAGASRPAGQADTAGRAAYGKQGGVPAVKAVKFGRLWDGKRLWTNAMVLLEAGRIKAVSAGAVDLPAVTEIIDLSRYTGLPGLIDVHTHMTMYTDETPGVPMLKQITANPPAVEVFLARKGAMRTLEAGVTTVRDLGSDQYMDIAMRDLINRGEMIGPRMFVAGCGLTSPTRRTSPAVSLRRAASPMASRKCCVWCGSKSPPARTSSNFLPRPARMTT